jgi:hypothetical protein
LDCKDDLQKGEVRKLKSAFYLDIEPGLPIQALFLRKELKSAFYWKTSVVVAMETLDN